MNKKRNIFLTCALAVLGIALVSFVMPVSADFYRSDIGEFGYTAGDVLVWGEAIMTDGGGYSIWNFPYQEKEIHFDNGQCVELVCQYHVDRLALGIALDEEMIYSTCADKGHKYSYEIGVWDNQFYVYLKDSTTNQQILNEYIGSTTAQYVSLTVTSSEYWLQDFSDTVYLNSTILTEGYYNINEGWIDATILSRQRLNANNEVTAVTNVDTDVPGEIKDECTGAYFAP